jgi:hypothetical protein
MTTPTSPGHDSDRPSPLAAAAWFVVEQPAGIARIDQRHKARPDGSCAGCGTRQPVLWPCVLVYIGQLANRLRGQTTADVAEITPHPDSAAPNPAARARQSQPILGATHASSAAA